MARTETAGQIINDILIEEGVVDQVVSDPFSSQDPAVIQIRNLLIVAGRQLVQLHDWQILQREYTRVTQTGDTGKYPLPDDFGRMIDQTGWSRDQRVYLPGSVTPQQWQYLKGRNLVSSTIYMVFREVENEFWVYPQPPDAEVPAPLTIAYEYISRNWAQDADSVGGTPVYIDRVKASGDVVLFDPLVTSRFLRLKFREARGKDTVAASTEWKQVFSMATGQDVGADALNVANMTQPYPYLDMWRNTPDTGYGH